MLYAEAQRRSGHLPSPRESNAPELKPPNDMQSYLVRMPPWQPDFQS
jgi:hypothetical protein